VKNLRLLTLLGWVIIWPGETRAQSHVLFTDIVRQYVQDGRVNYKGLRHDPRLDQYLIQLQTMDPDTISDSLAQLSFWINAYNAYTLKAICDHYPLKSINDLNPGGLVAGSSLKASIWDRDLVVLGHKRMTLNQIEHKIIRPLFNEPRAHFALVCASKSCPILRPEAYEARDLSAQLDDQGQAFLASTFRNRFDVSAKTAYLSKIFDWYGGDFGKSKADILRFIAQFAPAPVAADIQKNPGQWKIKFLDYDWGLNE
jgi:hypothetical protein